MGFLIRHTGVFYLYTVHRLYVVKLFDEMGVIVISNAVYFYFIKLKEEYRTRLFTRTR